MASVLTVGDQLLLNVIDRNEPQEVARVISIDSNEVQAKLQGSDKVLRFYRQNANREIESAISYDSESQYEIEMILYMT